MSAERDVTRIVRSWLREDDHDSADRVLQVVLDRLDATPQRRSWWPARRSPFMNSYARVAIAAAAVLVVTVVGYQILPGTPGAGVEGSPSSDPSTNAPTMRPSFRPGEATFTSTIHGIVTDYPAGWQVRPATEAWTGGQLSFDSPAADVIFDPALGDALYLILASQPIGGDRAEARSRVVQVQCPSAIEPASAGEPNGGVDGFQAFARDCMGSEVETVQTTSRVYLIELVVSSEVAPAGAAAFGSWLVSLTDTVDLRPQDASGGPSALDKPFAQGSFRSHGADFELDAVGTGPAITGRITMVEDVHQVDVMLECTGATVDGFTAIAGTVIESNMEAAPLDSRIALAFNRGTPIEAIIHVQGTDITAATCAAFIDTILDAAAVMEPIEGTLQFAP